MECGPATPAAHTVRSVGRSCPSLSTTQSGRTSRISVFSLMSTPRATSCRLVYSRSFGWNGMTSSGAISMSRTWTRAGSTSGNVDWITSRRSSAAVPGELDPGRAAADHGDHELPVRVGALAQPLEAVHDVVAEHDGVGPGVEPEGVLGRPRQAEVVGRDAGGEHQVVVAELAPVAEP